MGRPMTPQRARQVGGIRDALAYTIDGQGLVLTVQEGQLPAVPPPRSAASHAPLGSLLCPLTWEPLQRLLVWGAREGLTAAELLDTCRAGTPTPPSTRRTRSRQ